MTASTSLLDGTPLPRNGAAHRPLRLLLLAEACNPLWTGEPLVGYNLASALAARDDLQVTVVTQVRNRSALAECPLAERAELCFVNSEFIAKPLFHLARIVRFGTSVAWTVNAALSWPSYVVFEWMVYRQIRRRLRERAWDIAHRITPISPGMTGPLASKIEIPMLLGPLNGGLPWPIEHADRRAREGEWLAPWRRLHVRLPFYRSTFANAAGLIAGSRYTESKIPESFRGQRFFMPENGVDPQRFPVATEWPEPKGRFRFITVSRLVPVKAVDLVLDAMRSSDRLQACQMRIVGDGPERPRLEAMVREYGLADSVEFLGWLDQSQISKELSAAQAFVFPSVKDFGGGALFEGMSAGLPSIVVDYGGPGDLVTSETGIRLPLRPRAEMTVDLRAAMERMCSDFSMCRRQGREAGKLIREQHTWEVKADRLVGIYHSLVPGTTSNNELHKSG